MRVLFMGTPAEVIPIVEKLQLLQQQGTIELVGIVSQLHQSQRGLSKVESPVSLFAKAQRIACYQPQQASAAPFIAQLQALQLDIILTASYGQILSEAFLALPRRAVINIHPSLLPRWRGAAPVVAAVRNGETTSGVTICFTVQQVDAGNIIIQQELPLPISTHHRQLTALLFRTGAALLPHTFDLLRDPSFCGTAQDPQQATRCAKVNKDDGRIDWHSSVTTIYRQYLAYYGWPETFTFFRGRRVILKEMLAPRPVAPQHSPCGTFSCDRRTGLLCVTANDGVVLVQRLQFAGRRPLDALPFWNGIAAYEPYIFAAREEIDAK